MGGAIGRREAVGDDVAPIRLDGGEVLRLRRGKRRIAERIVGDLEDVAGDVGPGGVGRGGICNVIDAAGGYGISLVAAAQRVGDDHLYPAAIEAGGEIEPVVAVGAASVEGDEDLAAAGAGVDEEVGGIRAAGTGRIGRAVGQRRSVGAVE